MSRRQRQTKPKTNDALRQWARGVSFTIAMGRRQVYQLVQLHISADRQQITQGMIGHYHRHTRNFITSMNCLLDRGLIVVPVWNPKKRESLGPLVKDHWHLTRAGELVIELLKEAGIYEEVKAELEASDTQRLRIA